MKALIENIPIPIAGVALGMASLGKLLLTWSDIAWMMCGTGSTLCVMLLLLRVILFPRSIRKLFEN